MLRVVLDANIFVSTVVRPHSELAKILMLAREERIKLVLSNQILSEVKAVLLYPRISKRHHLTPKEIDEFLQKTARISIITSGKIEINQIKQDPSDNKYLAAAVEGKADFIVSGDHHLKDLKTFQGIRILDPAAFLELMMKLR